MSGTQRRRHSHVAVLLLLLFLCITVALIVRPNVEKEIYPRHYTEYVSQYAKLYGVPESLVYAVIRTESNFDAHAVSSAGAVGLMQITPDTFEWLTLYQLREGLKPEMCYDAKTNIRYGVYYLSYLYERYGSWLEACAAYNAGPGRVDQWLDDPDMVGAGGDLIPERIPFSETRAYVASVKKTQRTYQRLYSID